MVGGLTKVALACAAGAALLGAGCARPPPHRSDALERSRVLLDKVDRLESELHAELGKLDLFDELGTRHRQTTQIACEVSAAHVREIHRLAEQQAEKRKAKARRRLALLSHPAATHASAH